MLLRTKDLYFINKCLLDITLRLQRYSFTDKEMEAGDIVFYITDQENEDGSWYCKLSTSLKNIEEHFSFIYHFCNEYVEPCVLRYQNIIEDPERFYAFFMIELYDFLLSQITSELNLDSITEKDIQVIVDYIKHLGFDYPITWF